MDKQICNAECIKQHTQIMYVCESLRYTYVKNSSSPPLGAMPSSLPVARAPARDITKERTVGLQCQCNPASPNHNRRSGSEKKTKILQKSINHTNSSITQGLYKLS